MTDPDTLLAEHVAQQQRGCVSYGSEKRIMPRRLLQRRVRPRAGDLPRHARNLGASGRGAYP
jgi:hypothetical protein